MICDFGIRIAQAGLSASDSILCSEVEASPWENCLSQRNRRFRLRGISRILLGLLA
jgi:hypothetical protein